MLRRFFVEHRPIVSIHEAEALLGVDRQWIVAQLDEIAVPHPERAVPWSEVAAIVRQLLTPAELDAALGRTPIFPPLLRVTTVQWRMPIYLVLALETAVAEERAEDAQSRLTVEAAVARDLELMLDPELMDRLCQDAAFRHALHFPDEREED